MSPADSGLMVEVFYILLSLRNDYAATESSADRWPETQGEDGYVDEWSRLIAIPFVTWTEQHVDWSLGIDDVYAYRLEDKFAEVYVARFGRSSRPLEEDDMRDLALGLGLPLKPPSTVTYTSQKCRVKVTVRGSEGSYTYHCDPIWARRNTTREAWLEVLRYDLKSDDIAHDDVDRIEVFLSEVTEKETVWSTLEK